MRSHRFYVDLILELEKVIELPKDASHHCIQVLRYRVGDSLVVFNGNGLDYHGTINAIEGKRCSITLSKSIKLANESPLEIHLFQGVARGEKMDLIIQKAVELGVTQITPIFTERCNVKLDSKRLIKKQNHWQAVSISASEQSGRAVIVKINEAIDIKKIQFNPLDFHAYLEPTATQSIKDLDSTKIQHYVINLFIGPEGGLSDSDLNLLKNQSVEGLRLGPRILRTETAGLACIAILQSHFGDI